MIAPGKWVNMSDKIEYGRLMYRAMRRVIAEILTGVSENGLPGQHHFFITYDTTHPDVDMPDWLKKRYPKEITVVIQHWYENLDVDGDNGFSVTLNFGDSAVQLFVPFKAIRTFIDPFAEFGLRLDSQEKPDMEAMKMPDASKGDIGKTGSEGDETPDDGAKIISLDSFRK